MKHLNSFITETHTEQENFVSQVTRNDPKTEQGVKNYFSLMCQYGICMHPDDSYADCTLKFTSDQVKSLDNFVKTALDTFGDDVYEWGFEAVRAHMLRR